MTSFHPTPPGSSSLLQVSINSEEVHSITSPIGRGRRAAPGEGLQPNDKPYALTPTLSPRERERAAVFAASVLRLKQREVYRQCSNLVSSQLISRPTARPNSDKITTPASS